MTPSLPPRYHGMFKHPYLIFIFAYRSPILASLEKYSLTVPHHFPNIFTAPLPPHVCLFVSFRSVGQVRRFYICIRFSWDQKALAIPHFFSSSGFHFYYLHYIGPGYFRASSTPPPHFTPLDMYGRTYCILLSALYRMFRTIPDLFSDIPPGLSCCCYFFCRRRDVYVLFLEQFMLF